MRIEHGDLGRQQVESLKANRPCKVITLIAWKLRELIVCLTQCSARNDFTKIAQEIFVRLGFCEQVPLSRITTKF